MHNYILVICYMYIKREHMKHPSLDQDNYAEM